jgi:hypothetical protein
MTPHMKVGIAGVVLGFILLFLVPAWLAIAVIVAALAIPAIAWRMLDSNQRARIRRLKGRGQLGR